MRHFPKKGSNLRNRESKHNYALSVGEWYNSTYINACARDMRRNGLREIVDSGQLPPNELGGLSLKVSRMLKKVLRDDRPVDVGPCSDVYRRDVVGMASVATADTPEQISLRSIPPIFYPTGGADMACTPRVDRDNLDSFARAHPGLRSSLSSKSIKRLFVLRHSINACFLNQLRKCMVIR